MMECRAGDEETLMRSLGGVDACPLRPVCTPSMVDRGVSMRKL
jgi:hypothetical protein